MGAGDLDEPASRAGEFGAEAVRHPGPQLLAVAQAVVLEGDALVVGEQPQVVGEPVGGPLDERVASADVALVPDGGGEGVGVAQEQRGAGPGGGLLPGVLGLGDEGEVVGGEGDVLPLRAGPPAPQVRQLPLAELPSVLVDAQGPRPDAAAPAVVLGQRPGQGGGAGRLGAEDDHAAGEGGPHGGLQVVPAARGVGADGGAGHGEEGAAGVDEDGLRTEAAGQFLTVRLRGEDGVDPFGDRRGEHLHVGVPDGGVVEVHGDVVDRAHHPDVGVGLPHPGHPVGERDGFDGGGADQDRECLAPVPCGADEVVVAGVRRVELAEYQAVSVALHAGTSASARRGDARSLLQPRSPRTQSVRKPTYSRDVR